MLAGILAAAGGFFGSVLGAVCGLGIGIVTMIILPYAIDTYEASCVVGLVSIFQAVWLAWVYRKKIRIRSILPPLAAYFVITWIMVPLMKTLLQQHPTSSIRALWFPSVPTVPAYPLQQLIHSQQQKFLQSDFPAQTLP